MRGFLGGSAGKESTCQCLRHRRPRFDPWVEKISWRRKWQPTPVFLPGESRGWRSLVGYSPRGRKESDTTERLHFHFHYILSLKILDIKVLTIVRHECLHFTPWGKFNMLIIREATKINWQHFFPLGLCAGNMSLRSMTWRRLLRT